ncbi:MAG TPA: GNAT family N-acetyltransferase [Longimicrobiales bacterium]
MSGPAPGDVRIVDYEPRHRDAFRALNLEWIERWFTVEDADRRALDDPERTILAPGGHVLIAEHAGAAIGCCALIREPDGGYELAKMAVAEAARGLGIGDRLGRAAIERARATGARRVELLTNSALAPALALYRKLGFVQVPVGDTEYDRADVRMVLDLAPPFTSRPASDD